MTPDAGREPVSVDMAIFDTLALALRKIDSHGYYRRSSEGQAAFDEMVAAVVTAYRDTKDEPEGSRGIFIEVSGALARAFAFGRDKELLMELFRAALESVCCSDLLASPDDQRKVFKDKMMGAICVRNTRPE